MTSASGEKKYQQWIKLHARIGTVTNVIASVEATESTVGDSTMMVPLLASLVARGFNVKELSADKAYLSNDNLTAVEAVGAVPYVPSRRTCRHRRSRVPEPPEPGAHPHRRERSGRAPASRASSLRSSSEQPLTPSRDHSKVAPGGGGPWSPVMAVEMGPSEAGGDTNSRGTGKSDAWRRLWHTFEARNDEFLAHYHERSNVETTFSMVKRKFGASVRAKTFAAQRPGSRDP